jgi:hypothetical protein
LNIDPHLNREVHVVFKARKTRDGWFSTDDLLKRIKKSIDIFESKTNGFVTGLFLFDNAPSHQCCAGDALSAQKMLKCPNNGWTHQKEGPKMCNGTYGVGNTSQYFYFPDNPPTLPGWFKGMENIICKRGMWPENGLNAQCEGFKCVTGRVDCCCQCLLFLQSDFIAQKSQLEEYIYITWPHLQLLSKISL